MYGEEAWRQSQKNAAGNIEQVLETAPHKASAVRPPITHHENYFFSFLCFLLFQLFWFSIFSDMLVFYFFQLSWFSIFFRYLAFLFFQLSCFFFFSVVLVFYFFMWLIVSSLTPRSQHFLFCWVLSILALIWLVLMTFFVLLSGDISFSHKVSFS